MTCRRAGRRVPTLLVAAALLPAGASTEPAQVQAAKAANRARIWARHIFVTVRGEPLDHLAMQVGQQLMTRVRAQEEIAHRPVSAFAHDCTIAQLCDGLAAGFGYRLVPYSAAESVHFQLETGGNAARGSRLAAPRTGTPQPSRAQKSAPVASREPRAASRSAATNDPRLLQKLDLSAPEVDDEEGGLPVILEALAHAAQIRILADHAAAAPVRAPKSASQFLAGLNGLPLGAALDRTARAFSYRWSHAGGWYFFKPAR